MAILVALTACDPIYVGELRNNKDNPIEIKVCGHDLSYVNFDNSGTELQQSDTINNCKTIKLSENQVMPIVTASGIATPITYEDLGFNEIEITTNDGQIRVTGQEIMNLFKIEKKRNFIGIHTYNLYHIDIGQKKLPIKDSAVSKLKKDNVIQNISKSTANPTWVLQINSNKIGKDSN